MVGSGWAGRVGFEFASMLIKGVRSVMKIVL